MDNAQYVDGEKIKSSDNLKSDGNDKEWERLNYRHNTCLFNKIFKA